MKKFFHATILAFMAMVCGQALATTVVFDPASDLGAQEGSSTGEDQVTKDGITISASPTGSFGNGQQYRVYKGSTFTVSSTVGNITSISFTCTAKDDAKYGPGCFTDCSSGNYTYSGNDGNWSGDAAQVSWVASTNQVRMTSITVEVGAPEPQQLSISGNTPFKGSTTVTITPSNPDFAVYYTTDNSDPVSSSTAKLYTSPFTLTETTTVKAYEEDYDGNESAVVEKTFVKEESAGTGSGTLSDPFNAVAANDLASTLEVGQVTDESYYIKGKISSIRYTFSAQYGTATFYISDDGTENDQFYIYATYFLENKSWVEGNTQIKVGDDVIIYGKLTNYNGTLETASKESYIYSLNGKTSEDAVTPEEPEPTGNGTLQDPFNAVAANNLAATLEVGQVTDESYYIKGKISSIRYTFSEQYGTATFYISDDGTESNQFYIYATYFLENKSWVEGNTQIKVGDDVIIYGKITNYNGTLETASKESYIYSLNGKTSEDAVTPEEPEPTGNGTLQDPFNAVAANNLAATLEVGQVTDESYYIKGKISSIRYTFSEQYGTATFYISDDGAESNQFCIYATYYLENKSWVEGNTQIKVGDDVIICGKITNYNGTYETASKESYIYSLNGETSDLTVIATDIAQFKAFEEGQEGILTLDNAQVLYVGTRDVYVRDATGAIDFYNLGLTFEAGQILNGIIQGKKATYNDLPELTKTDQTNDDGFTREADTALPVFLTIAEARNPQYYCDLVRIQDVKLKAVETESGAVNYYAYAGDDELQVYDKFGLSINFAELTNDDYTFTFQGILVPWRGDYELYVTEVNYTSGIQQITEDADMATPRYNTAGQRVDKSYKGIVIQNGSKYIVK